VGKNETHLVGLWAIAGFVGGLTLFGLVRAAMRGEFLVPSIVLLALVFFGFQFWYRRRKTLALFRNQTAEQAVSYYRRNRSKLPITRASVAYMSALAMSFYGEFKSARNELIEIPWDDLPPLYQGLRTHVLTVIAILERRDYREALDLAYETRELSRTRSAFPGSKKSRSAIEALVDATEVLAGSGNDQALGRLEGAVPKLPPLARLIPAFALAHHYAEHGDERNALKYHAMISRVAPYCRPLNGAI